MSEGAAVAWVSAPACLALDAGMAWLISLAGPPFWETFVVLALFGCRWSAHRAHTLMADDPR